MRCKWSESVPGGEKTVFYKKCKVDFFAECTQPDGIVKRVTVYNDYKRLITREIRCYYQNRKDNLLVRRRFPYEFKLVEHYHSSDKSYYWKKLVQVDGHYRKLYFYHHRNKTTGALSPRQDAEYLAALRWVVSAHPWWNRTNGTDHMWLFPSGRGASIFPSWRQHVAQCIFLSPEGDARSGRFDGRKDIVIPGYRIA